MMLRSSEWVALGYFAYLAVAAIMAPVEPTRRRKALVTAGLAGATVLGLAGLSALAWPSAEVARLLRDWAFPLVILVGYWLPAQLVVRVCASLERFLVESDERWSLRLIEWTTRAPQAFIEILEAAYLLCYPLIPGGLAVLVIGGSGEASNRYWTALMWAAALSYGPLPWAATRPPRSLGRASPSRASAGAQDVPPSVLGRVNLLVLGHASVQLNTCPSGHVATSVAASLVVWSVWPAAGLLCGLLASLIALASVTRRYHYGLDVVTGVVVGVVGHWAAG